MRFAAPADPSTRGAIVDADAGDAVIWGVTHRGRNFRPSDWAERLAGLTAAFGTDQKVVYSPLVAPVTVRGVRGVVVGAALRTLEPRFWQFLLGFARDNDLVVTRMPGALDAPHTLTPPSAPAGREPREPV
jgi:hypothetical protein